MFDKLKREMVGLNYIDTQILFLAIADAIQCRVITPA